MRWIALLMMAAALILAPASAAHNGPDNVTILAKDSGCPSGQSFCFEVTEGSLSDISAGDEVTITVRNEGSSVHNLYVTSLAEADSDHKDTPADAAIANTDDLDGGDEGTITFTAPESADGLYLWCDISGHEQLGMWLDAPYPGSSASSNTADDANQQGSPGPGVLGLALAGLAAALLRRRR